VEAIPDPVTFFHEHGGLHDAEVDWLSWDHEPAELRLVVSNLHASGMEPSPNYPGWAARPATVVFRGVQDMSGHFNPAYSPSGGGIISDLSVERSADRYKVRVCGVDNWYLAFDCADVSIGEAGEPPSVKLHYDDYKRHLAGTG
jgi:hypothetical protein